MVFSHVYGSTSITEVRLLTFTGEAPTVYTEGMASSDSRRWAAIPEVYMPKLSKTSSEKCRSHILELGHRPPSSKCVNSTHFFLKHGSSGKGKRLR